MFNIRSIRQFIFPVVLVSAIFRPESASAQETKSSTDSLFKIVNSVKEKLAEKDIEIVQMMQLWDVQTIQNPANPGKDIRNDISLRRARFGVKGKIRKDLSYSVIFAYDGIGRDKYTAGNGNPNDGDNREFYLWDAFGTYSVNPKFNITAGYFRPQVGRENITAAFSVISFEKSLLNFYPRLFLTGRNTGREMGVNLGGLILKKGWSLNYNLGYFDLTNEKVVGKNTKWSPLITGRIAVTLGDPEMDSYKLSYVQSYFGKRKGVTLAVNATHQGETELFLNNNFYGADLLCNFKRWDLIAEYNLLNRNSFTTENQGIYKTSDNLFSVKLGYNLPLKNGKIIQFTGMYGLQEVENAGKKNVNAFTGGADQDGFDVGVNYLISKDKLKLNIHYCQGLRKDINSDPKYAYLGSGLQFMF